MTLTRQTTITSNEKNYQNRSVFQPQLVVLYWPYGCTGTWANASSVASGRDEPVSLNAKQQRCLTGQTWALHKKPYASRMTTQRQHKTGAWYARRATVSRDLTNASGYSKKLYIQRLWVTLPQTALFCKFWVAFLTFVTDEARHFIFSTRTELVSASLCAWQITSKRELISVMSPFVIVTNKHYSEGNNTN